MKLQVRDLLEMFGALTLARRISTPQPLEFSVLIARNWRILRSEVELLDEERKKLLDSVSRKDDEGNPVRDDKGQTYIKDFKTWEEGVQRLDRMEIDVELQPIPKEFFKEVSPEIVTGLIDLMDE